MRYQRLDLNLLIALRALLTEQSVTRAAQAVNLTQSAMSGALSRLREYFEDPLITQIGRRMELSPLAQTLVVPINELMLRIDATVGMRPGFDPATSRRRFTLVASDYVVNVLIADVLRRLNREAPGLTIELRQPSTEAAAHLEAGEIDLLIMPAPFASRDHSSTNLFEDDYCAVVDREHPLVGESIGLGQYLSLGHVVFEQVGKPFFEAWFERTHGQARKVEVMAHTFGLLPSLVVGTQRVATMHARAAAQVERALPVRRVRLDFEVPRLVEVLQWHEVRDLDPGAQWVREKIIEQARAMPAPGAV